MQTQARAKENAQLPAHTGKVYSFVAPLGFHIIWIWLTDAVSRSLMTFPLDSSVLRGKPAGVLQHVSHLGRHSLSDSLH